MAGFQHQQALRFVPACFRTHSARRARCHDNFQHYTAKLYPTLSKSAHVSQGSHAFVGNRSPRLHQTCRQQRTRPTKTCANGKRKNPRPCPRYLSSLPQCFDGLLYIAAPGAPTKSVSGTRIKDPRIKDLGPDNWNITYYPKQHDTVAVHKPWYIIDAEGQTLGRLAVLAACVLR